MSDVKTWMDLNFLKLNESKTEVDLVQILSWSLGSVAPYIRSSDPGAFKLDNRSQLFTAEASCQSWVTHPFITSHQHHTTIVVTNNQEHITLVLSCFTGFQLGTGFILRFFCLFWSLWIGWPQNTCLTLLIYISPPEPLGWLIRWFYCSPTF